MDRHQLKNSSKLGSVEPVPGGERSRPTVPRELAESRVKLDSQSVATAITQVRLSVEEIHLRQRRIHAEMLELSR